MVLLNDIRDVRCGRLVYLPGLAEVKHEFGVFVGGLGSQRNLFLIS